MKQPIETIPCAIPTNKLFENLTGKRFVRLVVISFAGKRVSPCGTVHYVWLCRCDCGACVTVFTLSLKRGATTSCGCRKSELTSARSKTHGMSDSPEYGIWSGMLKRCFNKNNHAWADYGGRGISVYRGWLGKSGFLAWREYMGPRPSPLHEIDRINNDGNYEPGNVRWATTKQQTRNTRRNHMVEYQGHTKCIVEWEETLGFPHNVLAQRLNYGWSIERAFTQPVRDRPGRRQCLELKQVELPL